ncbi:putative uncharacterized protein C7orf78 [Montipora foliosa]|uniref:putative uncharacterized protein C7orf78 n=1 Tax=Montipora foliosa TaxID=591990 RepID=UPI0035F1B437
MPAARENSISRERSNASILSRSESLPFSFRSQIEFSAKQDLLRSRSECSLDSKRARDKRIQEKESKNRTAWDIRPPNFTFQIYQPKPPKRNSRYAMLQGYNEDEWIKKLKEKRRQRVQFEHIPLPKILQPPESNNPPFISQFRVLDPHAAKIVFIKSGILKREPYATPGPHAFRGDDFRPLENPKKYGLPEFITSHEHDPGNLKFHSRNLNVLYDAYKDQEFLNSKDGYRKQMLTYREQDPSWESSLILPKGPYNTGQSPKSGVMDRIIKQIPWCPDDDKMEELRRPDIFDNKTVDWLKVTTYNKAEMNRV